MADYVVTSANAAKLVDLLDTETILFGPDKNLASYVAEKTGKNIVPVPSFGHCLVHVMYKPEHILRAKVKYPGSRVLVHPECSPEVRKEADFVGSTSQILKAPDMIGGNSFIIGTEVGIIHRMKLMYPERTFHPLLEGAVCQNMKKITVESVIASLRDLVYKVEVPEELASKVRLNLKRTFDLLGVKIDWHQN
jgi:quinolinate synthase